MFDYTTWTPKNGDIFLCIYVGIESRGRCKIWLLSVENTVELRQHVRACATAIDRNGKKNNKKKKHRWYRWIERDAMTSYVLLSEPYIYTDT